MMKIYSFSDFSGHTFFFFFVLTEEEKKYGSERLSDFPEVTQQTCRQGRNKVGVFVLIMCRALGKLKGKSY